MTDILDRMPYARFLGLQTLISGDEITVTAGHPDSAATSEVSEARARVREVDFISASIWAVKEGE